MKRIILLAFAGILGTSCVSTKVHRTLQDKYDILTNEADPLGQQSQTRAAENTKLQHEIGEVRRTVNILVEDTTASFERMRTLQTKYDRLSKQYDYLLDNNSSLIAASARENKALMDEIATIQTRLQAKEDSLNTERRMLEKGRARMEELERIINRQDSTVNTAVAHTSRRRSAPRSACHDRRAIGSRGTCTHSSIKRRVSSTERVIPMHRGPAGSVTTRDAATAASTSRRST